jgi:hypothetical protein
MGSIFSSQGASLGSLPSSAICMHKEFKGSSKYVEAVNVKLVVIGVFYTIN